MRLVKSNPNRSLISDFDRIFDNMFNIDLPMHSVESSYSLAVDIQETEKEFFLSALSQENVFLMNVDGISSPVRVPEGTYTGSTLAAALQLRINQTNKL